MDLEALLMILRIVERGKDADNLLKSGINYSEIGELCDYALEQGLFVNKNERFKITEKGLQKIEEINRILKKKGIEKFIVPYSKYKINTIDVKDIYIPKNFD